MIPELSIKQDKDTGAQTLEGWEAFEHWAEQNVPGWNIAKRLSPEEALKLRLGMAINEAYQLGPLAEVAINAGKVHEKGATFMVKILGVAADKQGNRFRICQHAERGYPIAISEQTGKVFELGWEAICRLAIAKGVLK